MKSLNKAKKLLFLGVILIVFLNNLFLITASCKTNDEVASKFDRAILPELYASEYSSGLNIYVQLGEGCTLEDTQKMLQQIGNGWGTGFRIIKIYDNGNFIANVKLGAFNGLLDKSIVNRIDKYTGQLNYNSSGIENLNNNLGNQKTYTNIGTGHNPRVYCEVFSPLIWNCGHNISDILYNFERVNNSVFVGEQIRWKLLILNKNGMNSMRNITGNLVSYTKLKNISFSCSVDDYSNQKNFIDSSCDSYILEEQITTFDSKIMSYYTCSVNIENSDLMSGLYHPIFIATDDYNCRPPRILDTNEKWTINPHLGNSILKRNSYLNFKKCISDCTKLSREISKKYNSDLNLDLKKCRIDYNFCLKNAKGIKNRTQINLNIKNCSSIYNNCKSTSNLKYKDYKNSITSNCNDRCMNTL